MSSDIITTNQEPKSQTSKRKNFKRLKIVGLILTILGLTLFVYFIYTVGYQQILEGIAKIGFDGFLVILLIHLAKICVRATSWRLSVYEPYKLDFRDTFPAVIIGEALSSLIPLGILMSGTAKAVAVRRRVPLVVGLSSVATENLFYSITTGLFIAFGAIIFIRSFPLESDVVFVIDIIVGFIFVSLFLIILMIIQQWHFASWICEKLYEKRILSNILNSGRLQVRLFENLIYGFYRKNPKRFFPIFLLQILFHLLGVFEVWFILSKISEVFPAISTAFFLETMSRLITIVFKLIPFVIGVDEAGAEFIIKSLAIGAGIGVTLAIIRKGKTIFWATIGIILIIKRGLTLQEIKEIGEENYEQKS